MKGITGIFVFLLALIALSVVSWFIRLPGQARSGFRADEKLVIITPHWDGLRNEFKRAFTEWYFRSFGKRIDVEYLDPGGTSDCLRYLLSEFKRSPSGIGVDLFFGGGTDPYVDLKKRNILMPVAVDSAILRFIPRAYGGTEIYDSSGYWYGAALSGFGIVYNKWVCRKLGFQFPKEWKDLADPILFSWIGAADPRNSGTMHLMFELILQSYGWDEGWRILTGMAANTRSFSKAGSDIPRMVARGDMAFGLAIDFYGWAEVSEAGEDKVGYLMPAGQTIIGADALAALKGAPNAKAAARFIEFVLSEEGQKLWYLKKGSPQGPVEQELNRMPVRPDLYSRFASLSNVRQNPFHSEGMPSFNSERASNRWLIVNDLAGAGLIDGSDGLKKAWRANPRHPAWARMPVTEAQADSLAVHVWNDPVAKNRTLVEWQDFFSRKYKGIAP